jgi:cob(I)alamin adenosyltransferase
VIGVTPIGVRLTRWRRDSVLGSTATFPKDRQMADTGNTDAEKDGGSQSSRGLVLVLTGNGKGKTTAALGTALRAAGYGHKVAIIQFIKGTWHYGEIDALKRIPQIELHRTGAGFYKIMGDDLPEHVHRKAARDGLELAREKLRSGRYRLVILDEINNAIHTGLLATEDLLQLLDEKPEQVDLVITGRDAPAEVVERADLVTEMKEIKHPFQQGILARKGIDY